VDNLTHSLFALTLSNLGLRRMGRGATASLVIASSIPDIEVVTALTGGRVSYLVAHRGPSHGPLGLLLAFVAAGAVWAYQRIRGQARRDLATFWKLTLVAAIGIVGHVAMDLFTSYGTRALSPFVDTWFGVDWMPIVDVYLIVILTAGLVAGAVRPSLRVRFAIVALVLMAGNYSLRAGTHAMAIRSAVSRQQTALAPVPVATPGVVFHYRNLSQRSELPAALPTPLSPFEWRVITRTRTGFEVAQYNVLKPDAVVNPIEFPDESGPEIERAVTARMAQVFLDFSRFPAADSMQHRAGGATVHWYDLRFAERPVTSGDGRQHTSPFAVWIRLSPTGDILGQGLGPG
jgi:membrane-bound metal-dependent hydrolase YbcI (DUF457 family)